VVTLKRDGNAWTHANDLPVSTYALPQPLPLNFDGRFMVLREFPVGIQGGAFIYRWTGTNWQREINFGAASNDPADHGTYGDSMAFNRDGTMLAIGYPGAAYTGAGGATGFFGETFDGAVILLLREDTNPELWGEVNRIKAPNPGDADFFGDSVALSGNGRTLAVGAPREDSAATGVDGDQTNNDAEDAGAVYLY
jgi:hypothetical protein